MTTVTAKPASEARTGSTVLCVAYRPRAVRWPSASNGTAIANAVSTDAVTATSSASNSPPPSRTSIASGATIASRIAEIVVRMPIVSRFVRTRRPNAARSPAAQTPDSDGNAASEIAIPTIATGTLWKLRAKLTAVMDPAASVEATLVKNRNVIGSIGWASILGSISQPNSWSAGMRTRSRGRMRTDEPVHADDADSEVERRAEDRADRRREDPDPVVEQDGAGHDPDVVEDRREGVEQEPPLGDEDLAQGDRRGEQDRRDQHQPEQLEVQGLRLRVEARRDDRDGRRGEEEQQDAADRHHADRQGEDRLRERRGVAGCVAAERREHRHEGRRQPGRDEDVEQELRQDERRVVRVELGAGAVGAGEDPVTDEAREVGAERQDGEQDRALGQEPREQGPTPVDHHVLPRPGAWSRTGL